MIYEMKINTIDRFQSLTFESHKFVHNQASASNKVEYFSSVELYFMGEGSSTVGGIQKREYRLSSYGVLVDYIYNGQYK